ncbi:MAG: hypothetical protein ACREMY_21370, partial [bacterium]
PRLSALLFQILSTRIVPTGYLSKHPRVADSPLTAGTTSIAAPEPVPPALDLRTSRNAKSTI